jgi:hypothetical protein
VTYAAGIQSHQRVYVEHATTDMPHTARKGRQPGSRMGTGTFPTVANTYTAITLIVMSDSVGQRREAEIAHLEWRHESWLRH